MSIVELGLFMIDLERHLLTVRVGDARHTVRPVFLLRASPRALTFTGRGGSG
jgi:hypothetical protein